MQFHVWTLLFLFGLSQCPASEILGELYRVLWRCAIVRRLCPIVTARWRSSQHEASPSSVCVCWIMSRSSWILRFKKKKKTFTVTKSSYIHLIKTSKKLLILFYIYLFFMLLNCLISYIHSVQMWRKLVVCFGENIKVQNGANVYLTCVYCTDSS